MVALLAVEAKAKVAKWAFAVVLLLLDVRELAAARHRAPAQIVHVCDRIIKGQLLVLFLLLFVQAQILDVVVTEGLAACLISTLEMRDLSLHNFWLDHRENTLLAKEVLAPWHEEKLRAEEVLGTNIASVLFFIKLPPIRLLAQRRVILRQGRLFEI